MRILGIDPGTRKVGFGLLDRREALPPKRRPGRCGNLVRPVFSGGRSFADPVPGGTGILTLGGSSLPIEARLQVLARELRGLIQEWEPDVVVVEEAFFGKSVQAALRIGESRGVVLLVAAESGLPVVQYPPAVIKKRVSGNGRATKAQLAHALSLSLPIQVESLPEDATDALAIAFCHLLGLGRKLEKSPGGA